MGPDLRPQRVLDRVEPVSGIGEPDEGTACVVSLVAHLAGEGHTGRPRCASPLVRHFVILANGHMPREARRRLKPFAPRLVGTNDGLDRARAEVLRRALAEVVLPKASGECQAFSPSGPARGPVQAPADTAAPRQPAAPRRPAPGGDRERRPWAWPRSGAGERRGAPARPPRARRPERVRGGVALEPSHRALGPTMRGRRAAGAAGCGGCAGGTPGAAAGGEALTAPGGG